MGFWKGCGFEKTGVCPIKGNRYYDTPSLPVGKHTVQRHDIRVTSGVMTVTSGRETHRTTTRY